MHKTVILLFLILSYTFVWGQKANSDKQDKIKKGFSFGVLPAIAYDSDVGFKYGGLANIYHYGDGSIYPKYKHSLYVEWSRTTKGSGINQLVYDSEFLIPKTRITLEASLFTEQALEFFGFNGYKAKYVPDFEDDNPNNPHYISRMYYRHAREQLKLKVDFQKFIWQKKLRFLLGYSHFNTQINSVDIDKLNKGKKQEDMLPDTASLYDKYVAWGIINSKEKNGGRNNMFRLGLVYDTRDQEANPMKGIWSEILCIIAPAFNSNQSTFVKLALTHRQYFTLRKDILNLAYRISYQPKIYGKIPFYMLPFVYNSNINRNGLGGARTLRGIMRNRIVGNDILYGNLELRWKFLRTVVFNQNLHLGLHTFLEGGMVTGAYQIDKTNIPYSEHSNLFDSKESLHSSYGLGLAVIMNHNFVINISYGRSILSQDGTSGLYIVLNYLF